MLKLNSAHLQSPIDQRMNSMKVSILGVGLRHTQSLDGLVRASDDFNETTTPITPSAHLLSTSTAAPSNGVVRDSAVKGDASFSAPGGDKTDVNPSVPSVISNTTASVSGERLREKVLAGV